jgi:cytidylate kinase
MALIAVSGHPGCRSEEVARLTAHRLNFEFVTLSRLLGLAKDEFGGREAPPKALPSLITSLVAKLATEHHLVCGVFGGELDPRQFPGMLRVHVAAPENVRIGNLMVDYGLDRVAARSKLLELDAEEREARRERFGKPRATAELFDMVLNAECLSPDHMAELIATAVCSGGLVEQGLLSRAAETQLQFQIRLRLARYGIVPPDQVTLRSKLFAHKSEELFANLLDFYRIAWEYEPRTFPVEYDREGNVLESFAPDFYLPELDLYVELTTMKQSLVTKKNRKVRRLRELYPQINIQVFYQKDFENLVFKYGLKGSPAA